MPNSQSTPRRGLGVEDQLRLAKAPKLPPKGLRGAQTSQPASQFVGDLRDPKVQQFMTTRAGRPGMAYVDTNPASCLPVKTSVPQLRSGMADLVAGRRIAMGPRVTYINDNPGGASPRQPLTQGTAGMVAGAIVDSGLGAVNINSTTGGGHSQTSRHYQAKAVDMNQVNGSRVSDFADPRVLADVTRLQNALRRQPNIRELFGPAIQEKTAVAGGAPRPTPSQRPTHKDHIHASGQS